jgi:hypothetical protein
MNQRIATGINVAIGLYTIAVSGEVTRATSGPIVWLRLRCLHCNMQTCSRTGVLKCHSYSLTAIFTYMIVAETLVARVKAAMNYLAGGSRPTVFNLSGQ